MIGMGRRQASTEGEESEEGEEQQEMEPQEEDMDQGPSEIEDWVSYIKRATGVAEDCLKNARLEDWVQGQRRRKWRWAGHVARRWDERWSHKVLSFSAAGGNRRVGHPVTRWRDSIGSFVSANTTYTSAQWLTLAQDRDKWHNLEDAFVQWSA